MLRTAAVVWLVVQVLKYYSSAAGPGTSTGKCGSSGPACSSWRTGGAETSSLPAGIVQLFTEHWPVLFGTRPVPFYEPLDREHRQTGHGRLVDHPGHGGVLLPIATIGYRLLREHWDPEENFCAYLVLTGLCSAAGYVIGRCGRPASYDLAVRVALYAGRRRSGCVVSEGRPPVLAAHHMDRHRVRRRRHQRPLACATPEGIRHQPTRQPEAVDRAPSRIARREVREGLTTGVRTRLRFSPMNGSSLHRRMSTGYPSIRNWLMPTVTRPSGCRARTVPAARC